MQHGSLWKWLDERVGLAEMEKLAQNKEVPLSPPLTQKRVCGIPIAIWP